MFFKINYFTQTLHISVSNHLHLQVSNQKATGIYREMTADKRNGVFCLFFC